MSELSSPPPPSSAQRRVVVQALREIAGEVRSVEVVLVSREQMLAPVLIGRRALGCRFLADPRRRYLFGRPAR